MAKTPKTLEGLVKVLRAELRRLERVNAWNDTAEFVYVVLKAMGEEK